MNKNIIIRLILSPLMLSMSLIVFMYKAFYITILFVRYGGEFIAYRKDDKETIFKIYEHIKNNQQ